MADPEVPIPDQSRVQQRINSSADEVDAHDYRGGDEKNSKGTGIRGSQDYSR